MSEEIEELKEEKPLEVKVIKEKEEVKNEDINYEEFEITEEEQKEAQNES